MKKKRIICTLLSIALALPLIGCSILYPGASPQEWTPSPPVTLEISFDPDAPGNVAFTWSAEAAELFDVTVVNQSPDSPEIMVKIRPQSDHLH